MSAADFIDSNIFVYLFDTADPRKQARAQTLISGALATGSACISFQVIQETLHVLTRKFARPVATETAKDILRDTLLPFLRVQSSPALYLRALDVQERYRFSFYDSLIIAAALEAGCTRLLSEDMQHGQRIENLSIENPFRE